MYERDGHLEIFSHPQAIEKTRKFLFHRTDILQRIVVYFAAPTYWLGLRYNDEINYKAKLTLHRITLTPARKPYRKGFLLTHINGD